MVGLYETVIEADTLLEAKNKAIDHFKPTKSKTSKASPSDWRAARIAKITALWCALADAGVVRGRGESAMVKWCARLTHKARLEWASSNDLNQCIEGLKDWAQREGVKLDG